MKIFRKCNYRVVPGGGGGRVVPGGGGGTISFEDLYCERESNKTK